MAQKHDQDASNDLDPAAQRESFWKRLGKINAGMLGATADLKLVPMSHNAEAEAETLWFITAAGTHLVDLCARGPQEALHVVADAAGKLYARIEGRLELVEDETKLDELWNPVAASWFEGGREDPDIRLLKLSMTGAEAWTTTGSAGFLYELAKNKLTGATPDMGEHFEV